MKITKKQLKRIIREVLVTEGACDKESGHAGCIRKRSKGWVVLSNKTGECWGRSGKKDGECTYYDSEEEAKKALGAYHR